MWVTKLLVSPVKIRIFCPKTTKFGPKLAFLVNLGQAMQAYSVPCWWVSWWLWGAGCISQDTYLLSVSKPFFILFETFSFWSIASEFDRELLFFWGTAAGYGSLQFSGCQFFCIGDCRYVPPKASSKNSQLPPHCGDDDGVETI